MPTVGALHFTDQDGVMKRNENSVLSGTLDDRIASVAAVHVVYLSPSVLRFSMLDSPAADVDHGVPVPLHVQRIAKI